MLQQPRPIASTSSADSQGRALPIKPSVPSQGRSHVSFCMTLSERLQLTVSSPPHMQTRSPRTTLGFSDAICARQCELLPHLHLSVAEQLNLSVDLAAQALIVYTKRINFPSTPTRPIAARNAQGCSTTRRRSNNIVATTIGPGSAGHLASQGPALSALSCKLIRSSPECRSWLM